MATIDTQCVRRELRAIADCSNAIKGLLRQSLQQLERDPAVYAPLQDVPKKIRAAYPSATIRKIKLESGRHNYRLIFAHWRLSSGKEHVDVLYAFRRQSGYLIDWDWVDKLLEGS